MSKRIQIKKVKTVVRDDIVELKPGVWLFTPAWKVKENG